MHPIPNLLRHFSLNSRRRGRHGPQPCACNTVAAPLLVAVLHDWIFKNSEPSPHHPYDLNQKWLLAILRHRFRNGVVSLKLRFSMGWYPEELQ
jgi:hypothetical protein